MTFGSKYSKKSGVEELVQKLKTKYTGIWRGTPEVSPPFKCAYTLQDQIDNEASLELTMKNIFSEAERWNGNGSRNIEVIEKIKASVRISLVDSFHSPQLSRHDHLLDDYFDSADRFIKEAKKFDPSLHLRDIHQALRNLWIINSIQTYLGINISVTPSAFAYSLLYPYTDNYLDDTRFSEGEKEIFLFEVGARLEGKIGEAPSPDLNNIFRLISLIEKEYPRDAYPAVYGSLLAIHRAQKRSLDEQRNRYPVDLLDISVEKGGTSVLADAFLTAGTLGGDVADFMFGFGVLLQFVDDLQDLQQDNDKLHRTIFTRKAGLGSLQEITNRLFNFVRAVLEPTQIFTSQNAKAMAELTRKSCDLLIFEAIARSEQLYPDSYLIALEKFSPLRFDFLRKMRDKVDQKCDALNTGFISPIPSSSRSQMDI